MTKQYTSIYDHSRYKDGKIEGKIEGKLEGKIEGKLEGKIEGKIELLYNDFNMKVEDIANKLSIPSEKVKELIQKLELKEN